APRLPVRPDPGAADHRPHRARRGGPGPRLAPGRGLGGPAGDAVVEVPRQPLPHRGGERGLRPAPLRVPHRLPRVRPASAGGGELSHELGRLRLRPGDRGPGGLGALPDRGDPGAGALLPGGVLGELLGLLRVRSQDPLGGGPLPPAPLRHQAVAPPRVDRAPVPALSVIARSLDIAAVLAAAGLGLAVALWTGRREHWLWRPEHLFLLLLGIAAYAVLFSFVTVTRHLTFATHALDLGYYVQLTWNLARGAGPRVSLPEMHAWGDHLSPIMYLFVPIYWLVPGPAVLLVTQSVALALGGFAVYGLARARLGDERPAAVFALLYLVNPSLHGINVRDFHAAALAIPLLLAAFWAVETGWPWLALVPAALTLLCREDAALPVIGLGAWMAV